LKLLSSFLLLALAACADSAAKKPAGEYVLVLLKSGTNTGLSKEESQQVFAGHFANMQRLAGERELLVAGPFSSPKRDPELRGLFVIDEATVDAAEKLAATDPTIVAKVMRLESHPLRTDAPLRAYLEHELAVEAKAKAEARERPMGEGMRGYVILTAEDGARAAREMSDLVAAGKVLLWAELDEKRAFAILDATDVAACETLLGERRGRMGAHVLDPWFGSGELMKLPTM
jgi:uncharacterized protein YciI